MLLLSLATVCLALTACGADSPPATGAGSSPPTTLTGNWLLAGSHVPAVYPVLSSSLYVQGNVVTGEAAFSTQCPGAVLTALGDSSVSISGTIAADGTFQARSGTIGDPALSTISLSLTGNSPLPSKPSAWTGTYTLISTGAGIGTCSQTQTAAFSATPIQPLTGTYVGVPIVQTSFGPAAAVSLQITQGTPTLVTRLNGNIYPIPLTANLTISNSPCPVSASTTGTATMSSIGGDRFTLFLVPGSPAGFLTGTLNDPAADSFTADLSSVAVASGCSGIGLYTFTRK